MIPGRRSAGADYTSLAVTGPAHPPAAGGGGTKQVAGSVKSYVERYVPDLAEHERVRIRWLDYDWAINDVSRRQPR